jgi:putative transposase
MPSVRISKELSDCIYFMTFTVRNWYYIFDRHNRFKILEDSFVYCQKYKGLKIYAFVFMLNHIHFIASAPDLIGTIRDMKGFLSRELKKNIIATEPNVLRIFEDKEKTNFWQAGNFPELIETDDFFNQKVDYIHFNPVKKQYIHNPEDWCWSSACKIPTRIQISELEC